VSAPPPLSVLLPVRDGATHLEEALSSVESQTFADFEVLAVDDGSSDATPEILAAWQARDPRVRVLRQEAAGIVAALERARREARGAFLARMDADDVCDPGRFAAQHELMSRAPEVALCGCGVMYFPEAEVGAGAARYERWINGCVDGDEIARDVFVECPIAHPTFFMRAAAVARVGGYREVEWAEDYDLVFRLWRAGERFGKVPDRLLRWRLGPSRLSLTDHKYAPEAFLACKVRYLREALLGGERKVVVWGAGPIGKAAARSLRAAGTDVAAMVELDPRKVGQRIHGAPVLDVAPALGIRGVLHVAAVGRPGARDRMRTLFEAVGWIELRDFVVIA
jgi:glycosyltransferase involved in cell wall biosynthesis